MRIYTRKIQEDFIYRLGLCVMLLINSCLRFYGLYLSFLNDFM